MEEESKQIQVLPPRREYEYQPASQNPQNPEIKGENEGVGPIITEKQDETVIIEGMTDDLKPLYANLLLDFSDQELTQKSKEKMRINLMKEYGQSNQKLIKKVLRLYHEDREVTQIEYIYLLVNQVYPRIELQYYLDKEKLQPVDIITLFSSIDRDEVIDQEMRRFIRSLFYSNYAEINHRSLTTYYPAIKTKISQLQATHYNFYLIKGDAAVKCLMSCYCCFKDQYNFLAIDYNWNELRMNHIFLELNKEELKKPYEIVSGLMKKMAGGGKEKENEGVLGVNDEVSSEEEDYEMEPLDLDLINSKLNELFKETLEEFDEDIAEKQDYEESLKEQIHSNKEEEIQKVKEEISQLRTNLSNYREKREALDREHSRQVPGSLDAETIVSVYKQLRMLRNQLESKLPIISRKKQLFNRLNNNKLLILEGETGSGKSTQLPQMLCQYYNVFKSKGSKNILLTQPRKLATRTLAERIASQLDENVHGFVDYVSSSGKRPQRNSKIVVMLDRLLLDQLERDPLLSKYHCLIIDEAHERTLSIDILIGMIKNLLRSRSDFHVIITSATLDAQLFESYFETTTFKVSGRMFPVEVIYKPYENERSNVEKIKKVLNNEIMRGENREKYRGHILVFCTSVEEINQLCNEYCTKVGFVAMPLHGKLTSQEQKRIFMPEESLTKLIFSTRIAETSVTIDKIKVVIDTGEDRQTVYDQKKKITAFELKPISKSAAKQRAGRAGRTSAGYCFRLYSKEYEQSNMSTNKIPEIKSVPLDTLVLRLKQLNIKDILNFDFLESPDVDSLKQSQDRMQIIGCLDELCQITEVGSMLVKIPIEPFMSRALAEGIIIEKKKPWRKILPQLLKTLVMIVNGQNIFSSNFDENTNQRQELEKLRFKEFADKEGDFFSLLKVYEAFEEQLVNRNTYAWCKENYLNKKVLFAAHQLYKEVKAILDTITINTSKIAQFEEEVMEKQRTFQSNKQLILSCILPSFCQELCLYSGNPKIGYTSVKRHVPLQIHGSSFLSLQCINPKWIVSFDVFKTANTYCRLAQAVSFDILKKSVPSRLFRRYKIQECEKENPFYQALEEKLPTVIFNEFKKKYYSNTSKGLQFLNGSTLIFHHERSEIELFMDKSKAMEVKVKLKEIIEKIGKEFQDSQSQYTHHYLGSVTSLMASGCLPKTLNFSHLIYAVKIFNIQYDFQQMISVLYTESVIKTQFNSKGLVMYFGEEAKRKKFREWLDSFIKENKKKFEKVSIKMEKGFDERRDKIASVRMKVRFFIGKHRQSTNVLLIGYTFDEAELMKLLLHEYAQTTNFSFKSTINKSGAKPKITVFLDRSAQSFDEVDFEEYLDNKMKNVHGWKKPHVIKGFRDVDQKLALRTNEEWIDDIRKLVEEAKQEDIMLKGYGPPGSKKYTDLTADIRMYDTVAAQEFKRKYNQSKGVLGNQKLHIQIKYSQTLIRVTPFIFLIHKQRYNLKKIEMEAEFPQLKIEEKQIRARNGDVFVFVESSSPNREDMTRPGMVIKDVFKPHIIQLSPEENQVLNKKIGVKMNGRPYYLHQRIFDQLRYYFHKECEFQMPQKSTSIKLHCNASKCQQIEQNLRSKIIQSKHLMITISYKGKNIHDVSEILQQYRTQHQVFSEIIFSEKMVETVGPLEILTKLEEEINSLLDTRQRGECAICDGVLLSSHTLLNCSHTFCKFCLISSVRIASEEVNKYPLKCPGYQECKKLINIHDLKSLFQQEEFDRMCDRGVKKMMETENYHGCFTQDCQMIFESAESKAKKSFRCSLCTVHYCYECKELFHPKITCAQFQYTKNPDESDKLLESMGFQKCGNCRARVEKIAGCNHMACKCGHHFCWKCGKAFKTDKQCQNHLVKEHGGIFDDNAGNLPMGGLNEFQELQAIRREFEQRMQRAPIGRVNNRPNNPLQNLNLRMNQRFVVRPNFPRNNLWLHYEEEDDYNDYDNFYENIFEDYDDYF